MEPRLVKAFVSSNKPHMPEPAISPGSGVWSGTHALKIQTPTQITNYAYSRLQDQEGNMAMPYRQYSPMTDPELTLSSTAGMGSSSNSPTEGIGRNAQRRREPARNRQDGGSRYTLRSIAARRAMDVPTSSNQSIDRSAPTPRDGRDTGRTQPGRGEQRLRNAPSRALDQPRRR